MVEEENKKEEIKEEVKEEIVKKKRGRPKKVIVDKVEEAKSEVPNSEVKEEGEQSLLPQNTEESNPSLYDELPLPETEALSDEQKKDIESIKNTKPEIKEIGFWEKHFNSKKLDKPNTVAILILRVNGDATPLYRQYDENGMFTLEDLKKNPLAKSYHVRQDCIYRLKFGKHQIPLCILPEWSMIPLGTKVYWEMTPERRALELEQGILRAIRAEETIKQDENLKKKAVSGKTIWIFIIVVVVGYLIWKGTGH